MKHVLTEFPEYEQQVAAYLAGAYGSTPEYWIRKEHTRTFVDEAGIFYLLTDGDKFYRAAATIHERLYGVKLQPGHLYNEHAPYICAECQHDHWRVAPISDGFSFVCPQCGSAWEWEE